MKIHRLDIDPTATVIINSSRFAVAVSETMLTKKIPDRGRCFGFVLDFDLNFNTDITTITNC